MPNSPKTRTLAFVGSVNRPVSYFRTANGRGISVLEFDEASGALTPISETGGVDNPNYLAIDAAGRTLYAVSEVGGWHEGVVTAYRIDAAKGSLTYINKQPNSRQHHRARELRPRRALAAGGELPDG